MATIDITVNGRSYPVACDPADAPRVRELAAVIDAQVKQLGGGGGNEAHLLVLAALVMADELADLREAATRPQQPPDNTAPQPASEDVAIVTHALEQLSDRIDAIARRLAQS